MAVGDQCAVGPDGQLLPSSEIIFYNDPDDDHPLPPVKTSSTRATNITEFFQRRSSGQISRPSARVSDPNNAESALKRKASRENYLSWLLSDQNLCFVPF
jgi:hypothetical protein